MGASDRNGLSTREGDESLKAPRPIRVVLIEDDMVTAQRLMNQCSIDGRAQIVLWAASAREAFEQIEQLEFDLALVDLGLPDTSGIEVIRYISSKRQNVEVLVLSTFGDSDSVVNAVRAGASGYLLKGHSDTSEVIRGLIDVAGGAASISPAIARHLLESFPVGTGADSAASVTSVSAGVAESVDFASLTPRERELLKLVAHGYMVKEIAQRLCLSPHTVSTHFKNVYRKLHVGTRGEAVFLAQQAGII